MKTRNIWMGIALLLSVLLLATCGGDSGTTPAPAPAPPPAPAPAPAPAPTPEPEPAPEMATYTFGADSIKANYASPGSLLTVLGAQPYPEGASASEEVAFVAHPMGEVLWEEGGMASEGLEHLAYDGHAHDLTDEARGMGWMILAEGFSGVQTLLTAGAIELSSEFPCLSYAQRLDPSPDWIIGFNVCAMDEEGNWLEMITVRAEMYDAGVRDGEPYMAATGTSDPQEPITRVMTPPWDTEAILEITGTLAQ
ncbi:MAG: spondin domain-containing protein [Acidobacteria bacterium]|nr:spondin domain-containing protein [Acidobacteriota bacterium]